MKSPANQTAPSRTERGDRSLKTHSQQRSREIGSQADTGTGARQTGQNIMKENQEIQVMRKPGRQNESIIIQAVRHGARRRRWFVSHPKESDFIGLTHSRRIRIVVFGAASSSHLPKSCHFLKTSQFGTGTRQYGITVNAPCHDRCH